jgi:hypothetical protein
MRSPDFPQRLALDLKTGRISPAIAHELVRDLRQFKRAEDGDRIRPDEYNDGTVSQYPTPFSPRDTHRPDRQPGSDAHKTLKAATQAMDTQQVVQGLQRQMGTDVGRPDDPVTLREQVEAAYRLHTGEG